MFKKFKQHMLLKREKIEAERVARDPVVVALNNIEDKELALLIPTEMYNPYSRSMENRDPKDVLASLFAATVLGENSTLQFVDKTCYMGKKGRLSPYNDFEYETQTMYTQDMSDVDNLDTIRNLFKGGSNSYLNKLCKINNIKLVPYEKYDPGVSQKVKEYFNSHFCYTVSPNPDSKPDDDQLALFLRTIARFFIINNKTIKSPMYLPDKEFQSNGKRNKEIENLKERLVDFGNTYPEHQELIERAIFYIDIIVNEYRHTTEDMFESREK